MRVEVTDEDIGLGERNSVCFCPVARALCRCLGGAWRVDGMGAQRVQGRWLWLPSEAQDWIACFDRGEPSLPFAFKIGESE